MESSKLKYYKDVAEKILKNSLTFPNCCNENDLIESIFNEKFQHICEIPENNLFIGSHNCKIEESDPLDLWIFGYGSLIFKTDFPFVSKEKGYICGWARRFYQNSIDHRGIPTQPGRVVTLISASSDSKVYGVAYKISNKNRDHVLNHLDFREKNGYERVNVKFHPYSNETQESTKGKSDEKTTNQKEIEVIMYIATENNPSYVGHVNDLNDITNQIYYAFGSSGPNREYVYNLASAMRYLFPEVSDDHLFELEKRLKSKEKKDLERKKKEIKCEIKEILNKYYQNYVENDSNCLECIQNCLNQLN